MVPSISFSGRECRHADKIFAFPARTEFSVTTGARSLVAESLLLKHQLLILNRSRQRAPNLSASPVETKERVSRSCAFTPYRKFTSRGVATNEPARPTTGGNVTAKKCNHYENFKTPPQFFPRFLFALRLDPVAVYDDCATEIIYRSPVRMRTEPSGSVSPSRYFCRAFSSMA